MVIPTYNEVENLEPIINAIFASLEQVDILIIDDASPDGTGDVADGLAERWPAVHVLHRGAKEGLGTAYVTGFRWALEREYPCVFEMDADFSHDPRYLPDLLAASADADLVIGSRYVPGGRTPDWGFSRRLISGLGNVYARSILGLPVQDCTAGYKCYRRAVLEAFDLDAIRLEGYAFQIETVYQAHRNGFRIREVPIVFPDRKVGTSKMSKAIVAEAFTYVVRRRFGGAARGLNRVPAGSGDRRGGTSA